MKTDTLAMPSLQLTTDQIEQYHQQGYLVIESLLPAKTCDVLKSHMGDLLQSFDPTTVRSVFTTNEQVRRTDQYFMDSADKVSFFFEEEAFDAQGELRQSLELSINKVGHGLHSQDALFKAFSLDAVWSGILQQLGMAQPAAVQSMYIFKQPSIGGEVNCHQDSTFLYTQPMSVIGLWFAIEEATLENGCLWGIPGGHKIGLLKRFERCAPDAIKTKMVTIKEHQWDNSELVALPVPKGSLVILNGEFPHLSYANRSSQSRHAYAIHAVDQACHYPQENWLQLSNQQHLVPFAAPTNI